MNDQFQRLLQFSSRISSKVGASIAALLIFTLSVTMLAGCTPGQQASAKTVVAKIISYEPEVQTAVDALSSTVALFLPADAALINGAQASVDAALAVLDVACKDYIATPNTGTLAAIGTALNQVLTANQNQFLAAAKITNPESVALAKAAIVGVRTILLLMDGAFQQTQTASQNATTAQARLLKLKDIEPYMNKAQKQEVEVATGYSFHTVYAYETAAGF